MAPSMKSYLRFMAGGQLAEGFASDLVSLVREGRVDHLPGSTLQVLRRFPASPDRFLVDDEPTTREFEIMDYVTYLRWPGGNDP